MKIFLIALIACLMTQKAIPHEQKADEDVSLQSFTAQTNYMSIEGYERYQHYSITGKWQPIKRFFLWREGVSDLYLEDWVREEWVQFEGSTINIALTGNTPADLVHDLSRRAAHIAFAAYPDTTKCIVWWSVIALSSTINGKNIYHRPTKTLKSGR